MAPTGARHPSKHRAPNALWEIKKPTLKNLVKRSTPYPHPPHRKNNLIKIHSGDIMSYNMTVPDDKKMRPFRDLPCPHWPVSNLTTTPWGHVSFSKPVLGDSTNRPSFVTTLDGNNIFPGRFSLFASPFPHNPQKSSGILRGRPCRLGIRDVPPGCGKTGSARADPSISVRFFFQFPPQPAPAL